MFQKPTLKLTRPASTSAHNLILAIGLLLTSGRALAEICPGYTYWGMCAQPLDPPPCTTCPCPPGAGGAGGGGGGGAGGGGGGGGGGGAPGAAGCGGAGCQTRFGMPDFWVSEPALQLRLKDAPLGSYMPGLGPQPEYELSYRHRGGTPEEDAYFSFGTNWSCSLREYVIDQGGTVRMHRGGAGFVDYTSGETHPFDASIVQIISPQISYERDLPGGGKEIFQQPYTNADGDVLIFISQKLDPQGNALTYNYSTNGGILKLTSVTDADGHSTSLYYENTSFSNRVTKVVDPFNRTNLLAYDNLGYITNLTDAQGLVTSFKYDSDTHIGWLTNMTTPYGTTSFRYGGIDVDADGYPNANHSVNRFIEITLPNAGKELYVYRANCDDFMSQTNSPFPSTSPFGNTLDNVDQCNRNSFYWSPLQYSQLSTTDPASFTSTDYSIGRLRHWLMDSNTFQPAQALSLEQLPSADGSTPGQLFWYDFPGKAAGHNNYAGGSSFESLRAWVLPDGSPHFERSIRNSFDLATNFVATYTAPDGTVARRTNVLIYAANDIDLFQHIGPNGEQVVSNYFSTTYHQPDASYDALNQATLYLYNANRQLIRSIDPAGLTTTNIYFASGTDANRLSKTIDFEISRTNSYTYTNALVFTHTNPRGLTITNSWDNLQRLTAVNYPDGTYISNVYTFLDLTASRDRLNQWRSFGYNPIRQIIAATNESGVVTRYGYCDCGALLAQTNAWNTSVQQFSLFTYDFQGNRLISTNSDGYSVTNWFDSLQRVITTSDGTTYRYFDYNNQSLVTNISNSVGAEKQTVFDIEDRSIYITDVNGVMVTNTYDDLNRLLTRGYPDGGVEKFGYSARGLVAYTNQIGMTNFFVYDEGRRKTFETNANNELIRYTNSPAGDLLALVDGKAQVTRWNYDEYGRVTNKLDQAGVEILRYTYDPNNRLTNRWSVAKANTKYSYDPVGNLTNIDYNISPDIALAYDPLNRLTNMVDASGTTAYTYTLGNQLLTEDGPFPSDTITNIYVNRLRTELDLQQPLGLWTNKFVYDNARRLTNVTSPAGAFGYTPGATAPSSALIKKLLLPNTSYITNVYDGNARLTSTYLKKSDSSDFDYYVYIYNPANQRTNLTRADSSTVGYAYDPIGQLRIADSSVPAEDRGYTYDAAWNLNWRTNNGAASQFKVNGLNELTNAPSPVGNQNYDGNGNLLTNHVGTRSKWIYAYDDENRLIELIRTNSTSDIAATDFIYDGLGRLRKRLEYVPTPGSSPVGNWTLNSETHYIYDGRRVIQERDGNGVNVPTVSYTRGTDLSGSIEGAGGIGGLLARSDGYSSGNWTSHAYYFADGNGNITYMLDSSQAMVASYRYDPYGNTISSSGTLASANVYRFSSKETHVNSGMYYYGYRFYDPNLQRWINRDPKDEIGFRILKKLRKGKSDGEPNSYLFVANDPQSRVDLLGLDSVVFRECTATEIQGCEDECWPEAANPTCWEYVIFTPGTHSIEEVTGYGVSCGCGKPPPERNPIPIPIPILPVPKAPPFTLPFSPIYQCH